MANDKRSELARLIAEVTPGDLVRSFFTNGGAEANENAIKLARWYTGRHKVIARYRSYHGATAGRGHADRRPAALAGRAGHPRRRARARPYTYRCPAGHPDPCPVCIGRARTSRSSSSTRARTRSRRSSSRRSPARTGSSSRPTATSVGARGLRPPRHPAHPRRGHGGLRPYRALVRLRPLGRRARHHHDGQGDQLRLRAARGDDDRARDALRLGRQDRSSPAVSPTRATRSRARSRGVDRGVPGGGHRRERRRDGRRARARSCRSWRERHPSIGDVRGLGLFWGVELVRDRETREMLVPFNASGERGRAGRGAMTKAAMERGLFLFVHWNVIMIAPPLTITRDELDRGPRDPRRGARDRGRVRRRLAVRAVAGAGPDPAAKS